MTVHHFILPQEAYNSVILEPIPDEQELELEGERTGCPLHEQAARVAGGNAIIFRSKLRTKSMVPAIFEIMRGPKFWLTGQGQPLGCNELFDAPILDMMWEELGRIEQSLPSNWEYSALSYDPRIALMLNLMEGTFAGRDVDAISAAISEISGQTTFNDLRSFDQKMDECGYVTIETKNLGFFQIISDPDGFEFICKIGTLNKTLSMKNSLGQTAFDTIENMGFIQANFVEDDIRRWVCASAPSDFSRLSKLALSMLFFVHGYQSGDCLKITSHFPKKTIVITQEVPEMVLKKTGSGLFVVE